MAFRQSDQEYSLKGYAFCRRPLLAPRIAIEGARCLYFDILVDHFSTSGALWELIFAPWGHLGGPWDQQDGFEMVNNRILVDFGVIRELVYVSFWVSKCLQNLVLFGMVSRSFLIDF